MDTTTTGNDKRALAGERTALPRNGDRAQGTAHTSTKTSRHAVAPRGGLVRTLKEAK